MLHPFQVEMMLYYPILRCIIILSWRGCSSIWGCFCRGAGTRVHHLIYCISPRKGYSTLPSPQNVRFPGNICFDIAKIPRALGVLGGRGGAEGLLPVPWLYLQEETNTNTKQNYKHTWPPLFFQVFFLPPVHPVYPHFTEEYSAVTSPLHHAERLRNSALRSAVYK